MEETIEEDKEQVYPEEFGNDVPDEVDYIDVSGGLNDKPPVEEKETDFPVKTPPKKRKFASMFKVSFSNFFNKPATIKYPFEKPLVADTFRGKQALDLSLCVGCGLCSKDCPSQAIEMIEVNKKKRPIFHLDRCIFCYLCEENCPKHAIVRTKDFEMATLNKASLVFAP
jgi:formate hydrogenlyase subunit 6/NADH:ubiquinone oxidoreductase subunit I